MNGGRSNSIYRCYWAMFLIKIIAKETNENPTIRSHLTVKFLLKDFEQALALKLVENGL